MGGNADKYVYYDLPITAVPDVNGQQYDSGIQVRKFIHHGQIYIRRSEQNYDMLGSAVEKGNLE